MSQRAEATKPFDAIIFDLGNTLIYFEGEWQEVIERAEQALFEFLIGAGLDLDGSFVSAFHERLSFYYSERNTEYVEYTTSYVLRTVLAEWGYANISEKVTREALAALHAVTQAHWFLGAETLPTLQALRDGGYCLGMISNAGDDADVQKHVDNAGLRQYFDIILTSAAVGVRKPAAEIFQKVLDYWKLPPERVAMVGDTLDADILGAHNAGIYSIWITRWADTPANRANVETICPDAEIDSLDGLLVLLKSVQTVS